MSFAGGLLTSNVWQGGSGPLIAPLERKRLSPIDTSTTEPISLGWKQLILDEILDVAAGCSNEDWDGYGALPISPESVGRAFSLIYLAPDSIRPPEVVPSVNGEIAFEWDSGRDRILSLMPHGNEVIFAAILGPRNNRESASKPFRLGWPDRVIELLSEYFPNARSRAGSHR